MAGIFFKVIAIAILSALLILNVYASDPCNLSLEGNYTKTFTTNVVLQELSDLYYSVLSTKDRATYLLLKDDFKKKLTELAKQLNVSEIDLLKKLEVFQKPLSIPTKPAEQAISKEELYEKIEQDFRTAYPDEYDEIEAAAYKYLIEINEEFKDANFRGEFAYDCDWGKEQLFCIKVKVLSLVLSKKIIKELNLKISYNYLYEEYFLPIINIAQEPAILLAALDGDKVLVRALYQLGAVAHDMVMSNDKPVVTSDLITAYFQRAGLEGFAAPTPEFTEFLITEINQELSNPYLISLLAMAGVPPRQRWRNKKASTSAEIITMYEYLILKAPHLFGEVGVGGYTPLFALANSQLDLLSWLVANGVNINQQMNTGATILHKAVMNRSPEFVQKLLDLNIDKTLKDKSGQTALDVAKRFVREEIIKLLE